MQRQIERLSPPPSVQREEEDDFNFQRATPAASTGRSGVMLGSHRGFVPGSLPATAGGASGLTIGSSRRAFTPATPGGQGTASGLIMGSHRTPTVPDTSASPSASSSTSAPIPYDEPPIQGNISAPSGYDEPPTGSSSPASSATPVSYEEPAIGKAQVETAAPSGYDIPPVGPALSSSSNQPVEYSTLPARGQIEESAEASHYSEPSSPASSSRDNAAKENGVVTYYSDTGQRGESSEAEAEEVQAKYNTLKLGDVYSDEKNKAPQYAAAPNVNIRTRYIEKEEERKNYQLGVGEGGKIMGADGKPLDTGAAKGGFAGSAGGHIFVMNPQGQMYSANMGEEQAKGGLRGENATVKYDKDQKQYVPKDPNAESASAQAFHHSSFLAGQKVASAGELKVNEGTLSMISNASGHYKPKSEHVMQTLNELEEQGAATEQARVHLMGDFDPSTGYDPSKEVTAAVGEYKATGGDREKLVGRHNVLKELRGRFGVDESDQEKTPTLSTSEVLANGRPARPNAPASSSPGKVSYEYIPPIDTKSVQEETSNEEELGSEETESEEAQQQRLKDMGVVMY